MKERRMSVRYVHDCWRTITRPTGTWTRCQRMTWQIRYSWFPNQYGHGEEKLSLTNESRRSLSILTVIPDRRESVLNVTSESVISSSTSCRIRQHLHLWFFLSLWICCTETTEWLIDLECQHNHAHMVHGSRCMWNAPVFFSFTTNVDDSCVLKRALIPSHNITIDPRYSVDLTIKFLHGSGAGDLEQRCLQWRVPWVTERKKSSRSSEEEHNHFDNGCCRLNDRLGVKIHDYRC